MGREGVALTGRSAELTLRLPCPLFLSKEWGEVQEDGDLLEEYIGYCTFEADITCGKQRYSENNKVDQALTDLTENATDDRIHLPVPLNKIPALGDHRKRISQLPCFAATLYRSHYALEVIVGHITPRRQLKAGHPR